VSIEPQDILLSGVDWGDIPVPARVQQPEIAEEETKQNVLELLQKESSSDQLEEADASGSEEDVIQTQESASMTTAKIVGSENRSSWFKNFKTSFPLSDAYSIGKSKITFK
jgi:hypothetical protein